MKKRRPWKKQKRCYRKGRRKDRQRSTKECGPMGIEGGKKPNLEAKIQGSCELCVKH